MTVTADVDGVTVTSPLTITEDMDGSTLTITASATDFESASNVITLSYIGQDYTLISPSGYVADQSYPYTYLKIGGFSGGTTVSYNGETHTLIQDPQTWSYEDVYIPVDLSQNNQIALSFSCTSNFSVPVLVFLKSAQQFSYVYKTGAEEGTRIGFTSASVSFVDANGTADRSGTVTNNSYINIGGSNLTANKNYHPIVNITF